MGLAEGTYYPLLAATATGGAAKLAVPFPPNLIPGGLPNGYLTARTQLVLPIVSLEWWLLDFGRRGAIVDAAKALALEATIGFNAKHQQVVFAVTRAFYALTAVRGRVAAARAALESAQTLEAAAEARRARGEGRCPRPCRRTRRPRAHNTSSRTPWLPRSTPGWRWRRAWACSRRPRSG